MPDMTNGIFIDGLSVYFPIRFLRKEKLKFIPKI
jgi:hypothetical protein